MLRIGLTGGMGAGKSTVSARLAEFGAVVVDSDKIAREVVEPGTEGLAALVDAFGDEILQSDGALDRAALASKVFGDDEARGRLNSITHPLIGRRTGEAIAAAPPDAVVVQDIPLLVENRLGPMFNLVIVVNADVEERVRRLAEHRNIDEADARARIAAQADDEQRRAAADVWLDNSGAPGSLDGDIRRLWDERLVPFEFNLRTRTRVRARPVLVAADPTWPVQAQRTIARLQLACAGKARRIDHIGSTAIAGLDAKDVLDIQITVADLDTADALAEPLAEAGFPRNEAVTEDDPKPPIAGEADPALWAKRLHGGADPLRPVHVHLRVDGWPSQQFALLFVDWLRAEPETAADYLAVKRDGAAKAAEAPDESAAIDAYLSVKGPWFDAAYQRAWDWAQRTGWSDTGDDVSAR